jgi:uncharacterized protein
MKREFRTQRASLRAAANGKPAIEGYAAVFNEVADLGGFGEMVLPGAFKRSLKTADVRCLMNHNESLILGRTKSRTLEVSEDSKGLKFRCELPDTQTARDLHKLVARGDVDQCSFGFIAVGQNWKETKNAAGAISIVRELSDVDLFDVSVVTFPAYTSTSCDARALWPDGIPLEVRAHANYEAHGRSRVIATAAADRLIAQAHELRRQADAIETERMLAHVRAIQASL